MSSLHPNYGMYHRPARDAAYKKLDNGARVVVMAEGMASPFLGSPDGVRLHEDPVNLNNTKWWGKDSQVVMEEVLAWFLAR